MTTEEHGWPGRGLAFLALFVILPVLLVFAEAFKKGIDSYVAALADPDAQAAIRLTLTVAAHLGSRRSARVADRYAAEHPPGSALWGAALQRARHLRVRRSGGRVRPHSWAHQHLPKAGRVLFDNEDTTGIPVQRRRIGFIARQIV